MKINKTVKLLSVLTMSFAATQVFGDGFFKKLMSSETLKATATEVSSAAGVTEYNQVKSLLDILNEMPKDFSAFCEKYATTENLDKLVTKMKAADLSACDADIKTAYNEVVTSTEKVSKTLAQMPDKSTLTDKNKMLSALATSLQSGDGAAKAQKLTTELKDCYTQLNTSRVKLTSLLLNKFKSK